MKTKESEVAVSAMPTQKLAVIASICNCTERHLRQLAQEGHITSPGPRKEWPMTAVTEYIAYLRHKAHQGGAATLQEERARLAKEQADKLEMENAAKRGELLHSDDVLKSWGGLITNARQALLSMSRRLSPVICHKPETEIEDAIEKEVRTILGDLAAPRA